jgi:hypothetical protein
MYFLISFRRDGKLIVEARCILNIAFDALSSISPVRLASKCAQCLICGQCLLPNSHLKNEPLIELVTLI